MGKNKVLTEMMTHYDFLCHSQLRQTLGSMLSRDSNPRSGQNRLSAQLLISPHQSNQANDDELYLTLDCHNHICALLPPVPWSQAQTMKEKQPKNAFSLGQRKE